MIPNTKTQYPERCYSGPLLAQTITWQEPVRGRENIRMLLLFWACEQLCAFPTHWYYSAPSSPRSSFQTSMVHFSLTSPPDLVPHFHLHSPDYPQCQVPCHSRCPNPGEAVDPKRTGCRREAVGSDDGGGKAEIHSKAGGTGQEEEGGKNPVKRWFSHPLSVIFMYL